MVLTTGDVRQVRALLFKVRKKWYDIGIELDLHVKQLDEIKIKFHDDPAKCLLEIIILWLGSTNKLPTWEAMAKALKADAVNEVALADEGIIMLHNHNYLE